MHATYEGNYTDGKKAGTGKMTYPNGDEYTGEWKDNAMEGEGTYVYKVRALFALHSEGRQRCGWRSIVPRSHLADVEFGTGLNECCCSNCCCLLSSSHEKTLLDWPN